MAGLDFDAVIKSLRDDGNLSNEQLELLDAAGEEVIGWDVSEYSQTFKITALESLGMRQLVLDAFDSMGVTDSRAVELPDAPPYLEDVGHPATSMKPDSAGTVLDKTPASAGDYDPADPTQWAKIGDQYFRWDGYRTTEQPNGRSHEITFIDHRMGAGNVLIPDPNQVAEAQLDGKGWFHKGYNCWILPNGKRAVEVKQTQLIAMRNA